MLAESRLQFPASPNTSSARQGQNDSFRLMGFGHRVYKNYDPRAKIMQKTCHDGVLNELGIKDDPLHRRRARARAHRAAMTTISSRRSSYPNIDFYSGINPQGDGLPDHHVHGAVRGLPARSAGSRNGKR